MQRITPGFGLLVLAALPGHAADDVSIIDIGQTENFLKSGAVFIDNRPAHNYSLGLIIGAVNLPIS